MQQSESIRVALGERSYDIIIQAGIIRNLQNTLSPFISERSEFIVTDSNVNPLYINNFDWTDCDSANTFVYPAGEKHKTFETVHNICRQAVKCGLDRKSIIIALGGGVCGDMAGFAAAVFMRGIDFIQVPTTLLAMVDSSVGGKTGVDLPEGKNLMGAFWQPKLVVIDPETLKTLPEDEVKNGMAEVIKYGMIRDWDFFELLEKNIPSLQKLDMDFYSRIIKRCCEIKADVVANDEREGGLRAILNYGHTFGHAVEMLSDFTIAHGAGVAIGMAIAAELSVITGKISQELADRQNALLKAVGLPTSIPKGYDPEDIYKAMLHDKKTVGSKVKLILPSEKGVVSIFGDIDKEIILKAIGNCCD